VNTLAPAYTLTPDPNAKKCDCAGGDTINCSDFDTWFGIGDWDAQQCYQKCKDRGLDDYYNLDPDGDDVACN
jgi:hypothetical protein